MDGWIGLPGKAAVRDMWNCDVDSDCDGTGGGGRQ
jgi:hypothetical protein